MSLIRNVGAALAIAALAACSTTTTVSETSNTAGASLEGTSWRLDAVDSGPLSSLEGARTVTMGFAEGRVFGHAGCNRYFSTYTVKGDQLVLAPAGTTMMYCEGEGSTVEQAFLPMLTEPLTLVWSRDTMQLQAADGNTLRFVSAPNSDSSP